MRILNHALLLFIFAAIMLTACGSNSAETENNTTPTPVATTTPLVTEIVRPSTIPEQTIPVATIDDGMSLRIWTSSEFQALYNSSMLTNAVISTFSETHPDVTLEEGTKSAEGNGGILNYLLYGRDVAPSTLPDVVLLPSKTLRHAVDDGVIVMPDPPPTTTAQADLYPVAGALFTSEDKPIGYPVALSPVPLVVYRNEVFTQTLPSTWNDLIASDTLQLGIDIPSRGARLLLGLYLSQRDLPVDETGKLVWDRETLERVLSILQTARDKDIFPDATLSTNSAEAVWQLLESGQVNALITTSDALFQHVDQLADVRVGPLPGVDGPLRPRLTGWGWTISTLQPQQIDLSADFITVATAPEVIGSWSATTFALPAYKTAFQKWPLVGDPVHTLIDNELARARPFPDHVDAATLSLLQEAVSRVLIVGESPAVAADRIFNR